MRILLVLAAAAVLSLGAIALGAGQAQDPLAARSFKPPRIAVVDISEVFAQYKRKKDIEARFEKELKAEEKNFEGLRAQLKLHKEELKNVEEGSDKHKELVLKIAQLDYDIKKREKDLIKEFQEKQSIALKEIKTEITADIEQYARSMEVDLVLEKKVQAEVRGGVEAVHWPIVHYVKPELEITGDIVRRLNAKYGSAVPAAPEKGKAQ